MAPAKRHYLHLDLPVAHTEALPQVAALFLILFDVKAGYTIAWKRSIPGLDIANSVEYKSLPSGLHNVQEDTVYFVHSNEYAGISSFINGKGGESERNALMLAVGALIPLSYGRLGKSWRHAETLKALAKDLVKDPTMTTPLEAYWQEHQYREDEEVATPASGGGSPSALRQQRRRAKSSPNRQPRKRNRAVSSASALASPGQTLLAHHPALSLTTLLNTFGLLVFPLYKAALLRKRILLLTQAPVKLACDFVYNISILSTLPSALHDLLPLSPLPTRLRTLFSVGVHDISNLFTGSRTAQYQDHLANEGQAYGWIACTTEDILSTKNNLYDILVTLPPSYAEQAATTVWPRIQGKQGVNVRGTQRDARRYRGLRRDLRNFRTSSSRPVSRSQQRYTDTEHQNANSESSTNLLLPIPSLEEATTTDRDIDAPPDNDGSDEQQILEPQSWSALAYNSFMWWASAGEARTDREEESEYDSQLFANLGMDTPSPGVRRNGDGDDEEEGVAGGERVGFEMALIAYFHRFTVLILHTLSEIIDAADSDSVSENGSSADNEQEVTNNRSTQSGTGNGKGTRSGEEDLDVIEINSDDMQKMGLDVWSESDRAWVEELVEFYWGRKARVKGGSVEC
ncbi:MAG: hypothetical protein Q9181_000453, partial [Wetmoreana brouardii]